MEKRKIYGLVIGVTAFIFVILGLTYAYFYWSSGEEITNVNLTVTKGLESAIIYNQGESILSTAGRKLEASDTYSGGISTTIEFWKKPSFEKSIYGQLSFEILKMLSLESSTDANIGKTDTVKWAVTTYTVDDNTEVLIKEGTFNGTKQDDKFPITEDLELNSIQTFYKVYVWLDENAVDNTLSVVGEILSVEISASASEVPSHYGMPPLQVLTNLGLEDKVKTTLPDFSKISPMVETYAQSIVTNQTVSLNSNITGNKTLGTGFTFDEETATYTLTGTTTLQSYNDSSVGKYTCNSTSTSCGTMYKINTVNVNSATTNYSEPSTWATYTSTLSSSSNKAVSQTYTFDGTYFQLTGTITKDTSYSSSHVGYYTCNNNTGTNCSAIYLIETVTDTSITASKRKNRTINYNYVTKADMYMSDVATFNEEDIGIFMAKDDFGTSYYFRGNIDYNYVKFGKNSDGADMYWRIIRINGDGTVRMIYMGTDINVNSLTSVGSSKFNSNSSDNTYVGYMYGNVGAATYADTHSNSYDSTIKTFLEGDGTTTNEGWYKNNIIDTGYGNYVADAIYCNDRSLSSGTGIGTVKTDYGAFQRISSRTPTLECDLADYTNDSFTVSFAIGNGKLKYPIGLITTDEIIMAGGAYGSENQAGYMPNSDYYLFSDSSIWTMSARYFNGTSAVVYIYNGDIITSQANSVFAHFGVIPVISLRADAIKSGSGTVTDPFKITG